MRSVCRLALLLYCCAFLSAVQAQVLTGYPSNYATIIAAARQEGKVRVCSATDAAVAAPLVKDFEALYPGIKVEYSKMNTTELYDRVISDKAAGSTSGDVFWSSAMDLQIKLVNDGFAMTYKSPEAAKLPGWASWRNEGYGTTYEPIVFVYNKRLLKPDEVPQSHADLARTLGASSARFKDKLTSYDIEKSGVGFLLITQDARLNPAFWDLAKAVGKARPRLQSNSSPMIELVASGESLLGFNLIGSYALLQAKENPNIGIVMPKDYTLVMSRVMFITKTAQNPNAAKLWLDYILSRRGQTIIANQSGLGSIRTDVEGELTAQGLAKTLGSALKPIQVGPGLLTYLDQAKRVEFIRQWQQTAAARK
jgi:iron(III) transport system substrate-binding protein